MSEGHSDLQELAACFFVCSDSAYNAVRNRQFQTKWIAYCNDLFAGLNSVRVAKSKCPENLPVYFDDGEVADFIGCQYTVNRQGRAVGELNDSDVAVLDDVIVRHDHALRADKETSALCYGFIVVRRDDGYDCSVRSFGYRWYVLSNWCR